MKFGGKFNQNKMLCDLSKKEGVFYDNRTNEVNQRCGCWNDLMIFFFSSSGNCINHYIS